MKILNFGSINIDNVYHVDDFVKPGETKKSLSFQVFPGGKGLNQSVALGTGGSRRVSCRKDRDGRSMAGGTDEDFRRGYGFGGKGKVRYGESDHTGKRYRAECDHTL